MYQKCTCKMVLMVVCASIVWQDSPENERARKGERERERMSESKSGEYREEDRDAAAFVADMYTVTTLTVSNLA